MKNDDIKKQVLNACVECTKVGTKIDKKLRKNKQLDEAEKKKIEQQREKHRNLSGLAWAAYSGLDMLHNFELWDCAEPEIENAVKDCITMVCNKIKSIIEE